MGSSKNNLGLFLLIIASVWVACGKKPISKTPSRVMEPNEPDIRTKPPVVNNNGSNPDSKVTIPKTNDPFEGKGTGEVIDKNVYREFNVGVFLPFNVRQNSLDFSNDSIHAKSKLALEFYDGALLALEDLKNEGMNINLYVYDTEKSKERVEGILRQPSMRKLDLMVGPVYNKPLTIASEFSKRNKVLMVSPFSPSTSFVSNNPYYLTMQPSVETHCEMIYNHVADNPDYNNVILLHQSKESEMNLANIFKGLDYNAPISVEKLGFSLEQLVFGASDNQDSDYQLLKSYLKPGQPNVFVITSFSENFVNDMLRRLYTFKDEYQIVIFGMPNWKKFKNINIDYLMDMNIHFTGNYHKDTYKPATQKFLAKYARTTNGAPSENTCKGYDMIYYLGDFIQNRKTNDVFVNIEGEEVEGIFSGFKMEPIYNDSTNAIDYYENKHLYISKYEDYGVIRVK